MSALIEINPKNKEAAISKVVKRLDERKDYIEFVGMTYDNDRVYFAVKSKDESTLHAITYGIMYSFKIGEVNNMPLSHVFSSKNEAENRLFEIIKKRN